MSFQRRLESSYLINRFHIDITLIRESLDSSLRWNDMLRNVQAGMMSMHSGKNPYSCLYKLWVKISYQRGLLLRPLADH
jgi:hypothetical protein